MCAFVKRIYKAVINTLNSHWIFQSSFFNCTVMLMSFSFFTYSNSSHQQHNFPKSHSHCAGCWPMLSADLCSHLEEESCHIFSVRLASYTVDADSSKHTDPKTDSSVPLGSLLCQLCDVSIAKLISQFGSEHGFTVYMTKCWMIHRTFWFYIIKYSYTLYFVERRFYKICYSAFALSWISLSLVPGQVSEDSRGPAGDLMECVFSMLWESSSCC